ncbi:hypothetical protein LR48_Vigan10g122700 [Vigna angularis]|uniref:Uncharacterized protein n=1 Tax=Phaseolus angularis TaxID=3914 RepID=A0A0L9VJV7_PHAAN|nr:hypothetical protein LR48_Vigan10g122700 [Vigna angularis]
MWTRVRVQEECSSLLGLGPGVLVEHSLGFIYESDNSLRTFITARFGPGDFWIMSPGFVYESDSSLRTFFTARFGPGVFRITSLGFVYESDSSLRTFIIARFGPGVFRITSLGFVYESDSSRDARHQNVSVGICRTERLTFSDVALLLSDAGIECFARLDSGCRSVVLLMGGGTCKRHSDAQVRSSFMNCLSQFCI